MAFLVFLVRDTSIHRAYLHTSGLRIGANTLGAAGGVYLISRLSLTDSIVGAFGLAGATGHTVRGDSIGHWTTSLLYMGIICLAASLEKH